MDKTSDNKNIGSKSLLKRIKEIKTRTIIYGHNHNEYGIIEKDGIKYINCSLLDENYKMIRKPIELEIENE